MYTMLVFNIYSLHILYVMILNINLKYNYQEWREWETGDLILIGTKQDPKTAK